MLQPALGEGGGGVSRSVAATGRALLQGHVGPPLAGQWERSSREEAAGAAADEAAGDV